MTRWLGVLQHAMKNQISNEQQKYFGKSHTIHHWIYHFVHKSSSMEYVFLDQQPTNQPTKQPSNQPSPTKPSPKPAEPS